MSEPTRDPHAVQDLASRRWKGEKILRLLDLQPRATPWRILEVGTGSGGIAHYFATHPGIRCDVTSVDVVDVRGIKDGYAFRIVDGTALPFEDEAFDVVITNHVIEHVGARDAQRAHLRECARVLKRDGKGYFAVPNRWMVVEPHFRLPFLSWLPHGKARDAYVRSCGKGTHYDCEPLTVPEVESLFRETGLWHANTTVRALRETLSIEGARGPLLRMVAAIPDATWRRVQYWIPTLIYAFARSSESNSAARLSHPGAEG